VDFNAGLPDPGKKGGQSDAWSGTGTPSPARVLGRPWFGSWQWPSLGSMNCARVIARGARSVPVVGEPAGPGVGDRRWSSGTGDQRAAAVGGSARRYTRGPTPLPSTRVALCRWSAVRVGQSICGRDARERMGADSYANSGVGGVLDDELQGGVLESRIPLLVALLRSGRLR